MIEEARAYEEEEAKRKISEAEKKKEEEEDRKKDEERKKAREERRKMGMNTEESSSRISDAEGARKVAGKTSLQCFMTCFHFSCWFAWSQFSSHC